MILTREQAASYARQAGFRGDGLTLMVAIATAESGLDTNAANLNDPNGGSFGLVQINGAHFGESWTNGVMTKALALDPLVAMQFAFVLSRGGTDFSAWGAFTNGSYRKFLSSSVPVPSPLTTTTAAQTGSGTGGWTAWLGKPARIVKLLVGGVCVAIAVVMLVHPQFEQAVTPKGEAVHADH